MGRNVIQFSPERLGGKEMTTIKCISFPLSANWIKWFLDLEADGHMYLQVSVLKNYKTVIERTKALNKEKIYR